MKKSVFVLTAVVSVLLLAGCEDLSVLAAQLDDEVKLANDRYLEVEDVSPRQNSVFVNPGQDINVTFDRDVDPDAVIKALTVVDSQGNTFPLTVEDLEFDNATGTLTIKPDPYLEDERQYTITLTTNLVAEDISPLRDEYAWSFSTGTYPKGTFVIRDDVSSTGTNPGFTTSLNLPLQITKSAITSFHVSDQMPTASTSTQKDNLTWLDQGLIVDISGLTGVPSNGYVFDLTGNSQGWQYIYMMFRDATNYSPIEVGKTFLDTIDPSVNAGGNFGPVNSSFSRTGTAADNGSGLDGDTIQWSASSGSVAIGSPSMAASTFSGPASTDTVYTITMSVNDKAGNTGSDSFQLDWDTLAPSPPSVSSSSLPTDSTPTWTWTSSGSSDAVGTFRRRLDSGSFYTTTATSYTSRALNDGLHTLSVAQYDDAGNISLYNSRDVIVNTAQVIPYNTQTGVSTSVVLDWPSTNGTVTYGYSLYWDNGTPRPPIISKASGLSDSSSGKTTPIPLSTQTNYYWSYTVSSKSGTVTSPTFRFSTTAK
ncbi:MAG: Ig-like domain-containing protein [Spirochaetaceae bacterium]|nr:Ig-like domain-containing protein [Spirochaetaceae bacterium]